MGKIIIGNELRCAKRQVLADIIPLQTPFLLFLEPTNLCNFKCKFCPTGNTDLLKKVGRRPISMSMALLKKIVKDLKEFPEPLKSLVLYKDGEPLLHPEFPEMYRYLKDSGVAKQFRVTSNGSLLNPELNRRLIDAGLEWIRISVEAVSAEKYLEFSSYKLDYEKFIDNLRDLYERRNQCHIHIKIINIGLTEEEKEKFFSDFSSICDTCGIENPHGWSNGDMKDFTLGGEQVSMDGIPLLERDVCPQPFFSLAINSNGTVSICCVDWAHETVIGDLNKNSLKEIWNGNELYEFRMMHLEHRRQENNACAECNFIKTLPDDIDANAGLIIERLKQSRIQ
ncbi:MAG: radical SAM/SPASM domain-containing protein [Lentisphaerota bacterium]